MTPKINKTKLINYEISKVWIKNGCVSNHQRNFHRAQLAVGEDEMMRFTQTIHALITFQ